jgi:hypothetical protein
MGAFPAEVLRVEYDFATARLIAPSTNQEGKFERFTPKLLDWGAAKKQICAR